MTDITEAQLKAGLTARYSELRRSRAPEPKMRGKRLRHTIEDRRKALELLTAQPSTPILITIDTPFLIWANRFLPGNSDPQGTDILVESHIEPLNSSAKILLNYHLEDPIFATDRLNFYFLWRNETGSDAVVNITSNLTLSGSCRVHANSSVMHGLYAPPFSKVTIDAVISVFEWWNEPPTEPLQKRVKDKM